MDDGRRAWPLRTLHLLTSAAGISSQQIEPAGGMVWVCSAVVADMMLVRSILWMMVEGNDFERQPNVRVREITGRVTRQTSAVLISSFLAHLVVALALS
jgi:hypothetical protein